MQSFFENSLFLNAPSHHPMCQTPLKRFLLHLLNETFSGVRDTYNLGRVTHFPDDTSDTHWRHGIDYPTTIRILQKKADPFSWKHICRTDSVTKNGKNTQNNSTCVTRSLTPLVHFPLPMDRTKRRLPRSFHLRNLRTGAIFYPRRLPNARQSNAYGGKAEGASRKGMRKGKDARQGGGWFTGRRFGLCSRA